MVIFEAISQSFVVQSNTRIDQDEVVDGDYHLSPAVMSPQLIGLPSMFRFCIPIVWLVLILTTVA